MNNIGIFKILLLPDVFLVKISIGLIKIYQKTFSPDHSTGGKAFPYCGCKYYPSCSQYAILTLEKHGFVMGIPRVFWRVLRCNPFSHGGGDQP